jgi:hypothetical protein
MATKLQFHSVPSTTPQRKIDKSTALKNPHPKLQSNSRNQTQALNLT